MTVLLAASACEPGPNDWISLFNGEDLSAWTPKIRESPLGEDPFGTFRVESSLLTVGYEKYDDFGERFGHLFYETPFSHYQLRVDTASSGSRLGEDPRGR